jgi:uncharacterized protein YbbK (DUF523 family)
MENLATRGNDTRALTLAISACLLGRPVRYDGGHKRDSALIDAFGNNVTWVAICPETECGLGIPREPMRLIQHTGGMRLTTERSQADLTEKLEQWTDNWLADFDLSNIDGFIFKARSPSCGLTDTVLYDANGKSIGQRAGLFAAAVMGRLPGLPVGEENILADGAQRKQFLSQAVARRDRRLAGAPVNLPQRSL